MTIWQMWTRQVLANTLRLQRRSVAERILLTVVCAWQTPACMAQCAGGACPVSCQPPGHGRGVPPVAAPSRGDNANTPVGKHHGSACRVVNTTGSTTNVGSGTLVATATGDLVLTCAHLFRGGPGTIAIHWPGAPSARGRIVAIDHANDLAALAIPPSTAVAVRSFADHPGRELLVCGYGSTGQYRCLRGRLTGYATPVETLYPSMKIKGAVRPGDSGGGVFNLRGELVGVVWGVRDGMTYATWGQPLHEFLARVSTPATHDLVAVRPVVPCQPVVGAPQAGSRGREEPARWLGHLENRVAKLEQQARTNRCEHRGPGGPGRKARSAESGQGKKVVPLESCPRSQRVALGCRFDELVQAAEDRAKQAALAVVREKIQGSSGLLARLTTRDVLGLVVAVGGPTTLAVLVAGWIGFRATRGAKFRSGEVGAVAPSKGRSQQPNAALSNEHRGRGRGRPRPIVVETPPLPQRRVRETRYVPYEKDDFARAYQWAAEQLSCKYPGAVEMLVALDSLIDQQLKAQ